MPEALVLVVQIRLPKRAGRFLRGEEADLRAGDAKLGEHLNLAPEQTPRRGERGQKEDNRIFGASAGGRNELLPTPCHTTRCQDRDSNPDPLAGKGF